MHISSLVEAVTLVVVNGGPLILLTVNCRSQSEDMHLKENDVIISILGLKLSQ